MNVKLTRYELQAIKERAEKATEGLWESNGADRVYTKDDDFVKDFDYGTIAYGIDNDSDADFIAASRQDIPKLLAEIERLQAEVHEHSAHNGQLIATHVIPTKEENKRLKAEVERLEAQEHFAEYAIRQNKALWEALSKACAALGADTIDYYEEALK